jgi:hypothetical protein
MQQHSHLAIRWFHREQSCTKINNANYYLFSIKFNYISLYRIIIESMINANEQQYHHILYKYIEL